MFPFFENTTTQVQLIKDRLAESPIAYRLARGAFWSFIGGAGSRAFTLATTIIIARLLGREGYGEIGMVQSTLGTFGILAGFGLGSTATKYIAEYRSRNPEKAGRILNLTIAVSLISGGMIMLGFLAVSPWLAAQTLNRPALTPLLRAGALLLFISTLEGVQSAALSGFESFRAITKINIWQGLAAPAITIPCVIFYGVQGAIAAFTLNAALGLILSSVSLKRACEANKIPCRYTNSVWEEAPIIWKFAVPGMMSSLFFIPATWITNIILANQPDGYAELGLFNAAHQWRMVIIFLPAVLMSAMLPVLAETHGRENRSDFRKTLTLNLRATWVVSLPLTVVVVIAGKHLAALFGKQFLGSAPIISVLMISCFLYVVNTTIGFALVGSGRMWIGTMMNFVWALMLVMSSLILVPHLGGLGMAYAYLLSYLLHTLLQMIYVELKLSPSSVVSQWKLILFSVAILALCWLSSLSETNYYFFKAPLIVVSFIPLVLKLFENAYLFRKR